MSKRARSWGRRKPGPPAESSPAAARRRHLARCWEANDSLPHAVKLARKAARELEAAAESGCPRSGRLIKCSMTGEQREGHCLFCGKDRAA
jgi:hypothetical protein